MRKPALDITWDDWNLVVETNLRGSFFVAQAFGRGMVRHGYARIINIGSVTSVFRVCGAGSVWSESRRDSPTDDEHGGRLGSAWRDGELPGTGVV